MNLRGLFPQFYQAILDVQNKTLPDGGSAELLPESRANLKDTLIRQVFDSISYDSPSSKELLRRKLAEKIDVEVENMISFAISCRNQQPNLRPLTSEASHVSCSRLAPLTRRGMSQPRKQGKKR